MIDDRRRRGFTIDAIAGSFRESLGHISVILIVQGCPNLLNIYIVVNILKISRYFKQYHFL